MIGMLQLYEQIKKASPVEMEKLSIGTSGEDRSSVLIIRLSRKSLPEQSGGRKFDRARSHHTFLLASQTEESIANKA